ncbi:unnamed protein product [Bursaphelenchus xylophilus]|uniref:(pine wood nematode) hypothetical protein n=1 Tax=Bursaphelenchus xylophilus TaxID=6326 RepID=A0A1I7RXB1_BURXY|nr:unnamed protein product [Bursaphelenchus xylophilus]CAG9121504.1 unnamed protein product [Bursaphelenchus xylophilus]
METEDILNSAFCDDEREEQLSQWQVENKNVGRKIDTLVSINFTFTTPITRHDPKPLQVQCKNGTKLYKVLHMIYNVHPPYNCRYFVHSITLKRGNQAPKQIDWKKQHVFDNDHFDVVVRKSRKPRVDLNAVQEDISDLFHVSLDLEQDE